LRLNKALERTKALAGADSAKRIQILVSESPVGLGARELAVRTGIRQSVLPEAVPAEVAVLSDGGGAWFFDRALAKAVATEWQRRVADFHRDNPLLPGVALEQFRSMHLPDAPQSVFDFILSQDPTLKVMGEYLHLSSHKLALRADEEKALSSIESAFDSAGLAVPAVDDVLASTGIDKNRARNLLQVLLRNGTLIRISQDLVFHAGALKDLRTKLAMREGTRFGVAEFKEWTGVSRKYAIPILEYLDRLRVTRREGDQRLVLPVHNG
jgi:selenocysteine-specific elongation factor